MTKAEVRQKLIDIGRHIPEHDRFCLLLLAAGMRGMTSTGLENMLTEDLIGGNPRNRLGYAIFDPIEDEEPGRRATLLMWEKSDTSIIIGFPERVRMKIVTAVSVLAAGNRRAEYTIEGHQMLIQGTRGSKRKLKLLIAEGRRCLKRLIKLHFDGHRFVPLENIGWDDQESITPSTMARIVLHLHPGRGEAN